MESPPPSLPGSLVARASLVAALGGAVAGLVDALRPLLGSVPVEVGWWRVATLTVPLYAAAASALVGLLVAVALLVARLSDGDGLWGAAFAGREGEGVRWPAYVFAAALVAAGHFAVTARFAAQALVAFHHRTLIAALIWLVAAGLVVAGALVALPLARVLSRLLPWGRPVRLRFEAAAGLEAAAWIAGLLVGGAVFVRVAVPLQTVPRLSSPLRAELMAAACLGLLLAGVALLHVVARRLGRRPGFLATPRGALVAIASVLGLAAGATALVSWRLLVQLDLRPVLPLGALLVVVVAGPWPAPRGRLARILVPILLPLGGLVGAALVGRDPGVRKVAVSFTAVSGPIIAFVQRATDVDRDGHSAVFGGGDCDEGDARIHVDAYDAPDDGIDQNCNGHQATSAPPAAGPYAAVPATVPDGMNVVLITIDALRADYVGAYGYRRPTTPHLDALAAEGALFIDAWAHAPSTRYSVPAILTARYPSAVATDARLHWPPAVLPENRLLSEVLHDLGFHTALIASYGGSGYFQRGWGMFQGFDDVDVSLQRLHSVAGDPANTSGTSSRQLADRLIEWLGANRGHRFFLWTHFYDPHFGFERHPDLPEASFGDGELDLYDGEIRFTDHHLGRVLAALDELGLRDRTMIIVTADHGDGFGEHGIPPNQRHGYHLYENETKVPLVMRIPGLAPVIVRSPVGHIDIAPTILNVLRAAAPEPAFLGSSRLGLITGAVPDDLSGQVFQEVTYEGPGSRFRGTQKRAIVTHDWHYIRNVVPEATAELYSRREPADRAPDVAGRGLPEEQRLAALLAAWMDQLVVLEGRQAGAVLP